MVWHDIRVSVLRHKGWNGVAEIKMNEISTNGFACECN